MQTENDVVDAQSRSLSAPNCFARHSTLTCCSPREIAPAETRNELSSTPARFSELFNLSLSTTTLSYRDNGPGSTLVDRQDFIFVGNCKRSWSLTFFRVNSISTEADGQSTEGDQAPPVPGSSARRPWANFTHSNFNRAKLLETEDPAHRLVQAEGIV